MSTKPLPPSTLYLLPLLTLYTDTAAKLPYSLRSAVEGRPGKAHSGRVQLHSGCSTEIIFIRVCAAAADTCQSLSVSLSLSSWPSSADPNIESAASLSLGTSRKAFSASAAASADRFAPVGWISPCAPRRGIRAALEEEHL